MIPSSTAGGMHSRGVGKRGGCGRSDREGRVWERGEGVGGRGGCWREGVGVGDREGKGVGKSLLSSPDF